MVYKGSNTYHINSVEPIEVFYNIRTDLEKLNYAVHINKIIQDITHENQNCYNILKLYLNTLYTISETDKDLDLTISIFKLRLLCMLGFAPKIEQCVNCKEKKEKLYNFSLKDNGFKCQSCSKQDKSAITMSESTANAIIYTITASSKKIFSFNIKGEALEEYKLIAKLYFNEKLEKEYKLDNFF